MSYTSNNALFMDLTDEQEADFRKYARENYREMLDELAESPGKWTLWHPVTVAEFFTMRAETGT